MAGGKEKVLLSWQKDEEIAQLHEEGGNLALTEDGGFQIVNKKVGRLFPRLINGDGLYSTYSVLKGCSS